MSVTPRPSKSILTKFKFYKTNSPSSISSKPIGWFYTQASKKNIKDIVKIKENFLNLSAQKVEKVYKILNNSKKNKPKLNITAKIFFRKQVIILMSSLNRFIAKSNQYVTNINRLLKMSNLVSWLILYVLITKKWLSLLTK